MSTDRRRTVSNAVISSCEFAVAGVGLFLLYRFVLRQVGPDQLGLWSVAVATTSTTSLGNLGLTAGVVKYVAQYLARGDREQASAVIETAFVTIGVLTAACLAAAYPIIWRLSPVLVPEDAVRHLRGILPLVLVATWPASLARVFTAGLDGHQRIDLRGLLGIGVSLVYILIAFILVSQHGLMGLAWAYAARSVLLLVGSRVLLHHVANKLPLVPIRWRRDIFREMLGYGARSQVISIAVMFTDPLAKVYMARLGGLAAAGYFEVAHRMLLQLRGLLVQANRVVVPLVAELHEHTPNSVRDLYVRSLRLMSFIAFPFFAGVVTFAPIVGEVWFGATDNFFAVFSVSVAAAYMVNALCNPAYFVNMGTGRLRTNVNAHLAMATLNAVFGYAMGRAFGAYGVAAGWCLAVSAASLYIIVAHGREDHGASVLLVLRENILLIAVSVAVPILSLLLDRRLSTMGLPAVMRVVILVVLFAAALGAPVWRHPMRRPVQVWAQNLLAPRAVAESPDAK